MAFQWQTEAGEEVAIEDVEHGDALIWPGREKALRVVGRPHSRTVVGSTVRIIFTFSLARELVIDGPEDGRYRLRPKQRGEGYILETRRNGNRVDGPEKLYRL